MPATLHELISSDDDGTPGRDEQPQPNATAQEGRILEISSVALRYSQTICAIRGDGLLASQWQWATLNSELVFQHPLAKRSAQ